MLQVSDFRETRVYQEALEEGREEERQRSIAAMAVWKLSVEDIARFLDLDVNVVRQTLAGNQLRTISKLSDMKMPAAQIASLMRLDVEVVRKIVGKKE